jgi:uncharacterized protein with HEPN domain
MRGGDEVRLRHMLDAAKEAVSFAEGRTRASLEKDRIFELALVKAIEIIGEAAAQLTQERRDSLPQIPWANVIGMRNRLIHAYFDINRDILWKTITDDLPPLIRELDRLQEKV